MLPSRPLDDGDSMRLTPDQARIDLVCVRTSQHTSAAAMRPGVLLASEASGCLTEIQPIVPTLTRAAARTINASTRVLGINPARSDLDSEFKPVRDGVGA